MGGTNTQKSAANTEAGHQHYHQNSKNNLGFGLVTDTSSEVEILMMLVQPAPTLHWNQSSYLHQSPRVLSSLETLHRDLICQVPLIHQLFLI
jgi:hypothetical protein